MLKRILRFIGWITEDKKDEKPNPLMIGEPAYDVKNQLLRVGDGVNPNGVVVSTIVVGPHDKNCYVKLDSNTKLTPIRFMEGSVMEGSVMNVGEK